MQVYHNLITAFIRTRLGGWLFLHFFNPIDTRLLRWSRGRFSTGIGTFYQKNLVLLRCKGAKSGQMREIPLLTTPFGDNFILIASAGGHAKNPAWYYNLKAHPECAIFTRRLGEVPCIAHEAEGEERAQAWAAANVQYPGYNNYQERTNREIPVMVLVSVG